MCHMADTDCLLQLPRHMLWYQAWSRQSTWYHWNAAPHGHPGTSRFPRHNQLHATLHAAYATLQNASLGTHKEKIIHFLWMRPSNMPSNRSRLYGYGISATTCNHGKAVTIQADASSRGLIASIIEKGQPTAFKFNSLADNGTRYANN